MWSTTNLLVVGVVKTFGREGVGLIAAKNHIAN